MQDSLIDISIPGSCIRMTLVAYGNASLRSAAGHCTLKFRPFVSTFDFTLLEIVIDAASVFVDLDLKGCKFAEPLPRACRFPVILQFFGCHIGRCAYPSRQTGVVG